jgi:capsular exopolysaccharide synthesis family protein
VLSVQDEANSGNAAVVSEPGRVPGAVVPSERRAILRKETMSRIYEALKRAEEERSADQTSGISGPRFPQAPVTPASGNTEPISTINTLTRGSVIVPPQGQGGVLRFNELWKHCTQQDWHLDPDVNIFHKSDMTERGAEQFRTLRSRLYLLRGKNKKQLRTLLVTSAIPAEGQTLVASNLAQAIVQQPDRCALIIDADLRRSRLHVPLGAPVAPGLTDYLRGEADEMAVIQHGQEANLCLIAGGNEVANPSELLLNGRLNTLLERVVPAFDWIILDSPPCLSVSDASMLADLCDGVLLVVRAGSTPSATAQRACQELQRKNVVGVVLNAVAEAPAYGAYDSSDYGMGRSESMRSRK